MKPFVKKRLEKLRDKLQAVKFDTFLVMVEENRRYLSGFTGHDTQFDESAGALFITADKQILATNSIHAFQAENESTGFEIYRYEKGLAHSLMEVLDTLGTQRLGFESRKLSYLQYKSFGEQLEKANAPVALIPSEGLVEELRMIKEPEELKAIQRSLSLSENVFESVRAELSPGVSEKALAWTIEKRLREHGADAAAFPPIVASGANGALPHAVPTDKPIAEGEPILFDWGARMEGYCSDISRTVLLGKTDEQFKKVYQVVREAQAMAIDAAIPGATTQDVDKTARDHITTKGFGDYFGHGLGHGVGLATHEKPHLIPSRPTNLEAGMVTTIEPGIYIPGWGGVRLENMIYIEEGGAKVLNGSPL